MKEIFNEIYSQHDQRLIDAARHTDYTEWRKVFDMAYDARSRRAHEKILRIAKNLKEKVKIYAKEN